MKKVRSAAPYLITTQDLRYHESKFNFVEEAKAWAQRNNINISPSVIDEMYLDIQLMERPREFRFDKSFSKITNSKEG